MFAWNVTQRRLAVTYRRFGTTIGPETSVTVNLRCATPQQRENLV